MEIYSYKESIQDILSTVPTDEIHIYSLLELKVDIHLSIKEKKNLLSLFVFNCLTYRKNLKQITHYSTV